MKISTVSPTIKSNDNCIVKNYLMVINEYPYRNTILVLTILLSIN
ncbi:Uncharacterised protein [Escherichia coli]|uniref:Uncharacterized protein n=1 Tax=Escherichia coli TaxID=562 RepID=A0A376MN17_ECOLX|nr:Uncharacterised protein [Escherichia coli]